MLTKLDTFLYSHLSRITHATLHKRTAIFFYNFWILVIVLAAIECVGRGNSMRIMLFATHVILYIISIICVVRTSIEVESVVAVLGIFLGAVSAVLVIFSCGNGDYSWIIPRLIISFGRLAWLVYRILYLYRARYKLLEFARREGLLREEVVYE